MKRNADISGIKTLFSLFLKKNEFPFLSKIKAEKSPDIKKNTSILNEWIKYIKETNISGVWRGDK